MVLHFTLAQLISVGAGSVVPLAVALLAKLQAPRQVKSILNVLLTTLAGAVTTVAVSNDTTVAAYLTDIALAWFASVAGYLGFHKPTGLAGLVAFKTRRFGFGREAPAGRAPENSSIPPVPSSIDQGGPR